MRIIFVPQFPSEMRYQEWWYTEFPKQFEAHGFEVLTLGEKYLDVIKHRRSTLDMFSPINQAIEFETEQIREYMLLDIRDDDILFLADLSFPGFFANVLFHKQCPRMFAFCHATSLNYADYFEGVRYSKFPTESAHAEMFNAVFVGSEYHEYKLNWPNTLVTYLPFQPVEYKIAGVDKTTDVMSASRPSPQKVDSELEAYIEKEMGIKIKRPVSDTWGQYSWNLQESKVLLITAKEDTFGYQIVDAINNNCIPIARNALSYPELLEREYLYENDLELLGKLELLTNVDSPPPVPKLLCREQMNKFYDVICEVMKG